MSHAHLFLATPTDYQVLADWLREHGAVATNGNYLQPDYSSSQGLTIHFPQFGPISLWPDMIDGTEYPGGSPRWKLAMLARIRQQAEPARKLIDVDNSPVALLKIPHKRNGQLWTTGELEFPTSKLRERFPGLEKYNSQFQRWLRSFPLVFDNTVKPPRNEFLPRLGGMGSFLTRLYSLPEAAQSLAAGQCFVHHLISDLSFERYLHEVELRGTKP
jgi:hypothetical protein